MRTFLLVIILFSSFAYGKGQLLLIGGGNRSQEILRAMVKLSSGKILIIPLASSIPDEVSASAKTQLQNVGASEVKVFSCLRENVDLPICQKEIRETNLIYFTGGSQNDLLSSLSGTESMKLIRKRFSENLHLAGTSAGTAIMSEVMLTGNGAETTRGFGFVKSYILDQHFLKRNRQHRLLSAVLENPLLVGVGIDESTAILIEEDESFTVIGDSMVMIIDALTSQSVSTSLLAPGTSYKLP